METHFGALSGIDLGARVKDLNHSATLLLDSSLVVLTTGSNAISRSSNFDGELLLQLTYVGVT